MKQEREQGGLAVIEDAPKPLIPAAAPGNLLQAIAVAASNPAMDMDRAERLFKMHQELVAKQAEADWNAAMARAQAKIQPIANNKSNSHTSSRYADLAAINAVIVPLYASEGLSISFNSGPCETQGWYRTIAKVSHSAGHTREYHLDLPLDDAGAKGGINKTGVQAMGSTSSYARRYLERMIFNLSTGDDNDGNKSKDAPKSEKVDPKQVADWDSAVEVCDDLDKLKELGAVITAACQKMNDLDTYNLMKGKVAARRSVLKAAK